MGCYKCICQFCAYSCELDLCYRTLGEIDEYCWTCDECKHYDGNPSKQRMWRTECPNYKEPIKRADHLAEMQREKLNVIGGNQL